MSKVLVVLETTASGLRSSSLPGITCGQKVAAAAGGELHLLVLGANPQGVAQSVAAAGYGAKAVHALADAALEPFTAEAWADAIVHAARTLGATHVGGTATSSLRDALPRAAAILDAPLVPEIVAVKSGDTFTRPVSAGRALLDVQAKGSNTWCYVLATRTLSSGACP